MLVRLLMCMASRHLDDVYFLCLQPLVAAGLPKQTPRRKVGRSVYLISTAAAAVPALSLHTCCTLTSVILLLQEHRAVSMAEQICLGTLAAILIGELLSTCKCSCSILCCCKENCTAHWHEGAIRFCNWYNLGHRPLRLDACTHPMQASSCPHKYIHRKLVQFPW